MMTWQQAWSEALYGARGFYRQDGGPGAHFATSAQGIPGVDAIFASAIVALAQDSGAQVIVDFASGRGELLRALATQEALPAGIGLVGIDIVERPADLPADVEWLTSPGGQAVPDMSFLAGRRAFVIAHEWLDVVPMTIAQADDDGVLRQVSVSKHGLEHLEDPLNDEDAAWAHMWWPGPYTPGERVEIGLTRDRAWETLCAQVTRHGAPGSVILGIDYGHWREKRPGLGTLTGFRDGIECSPTPDGTCDITAHVAIDSLHPHTFTTQRGMFIELFGNIAAQPIDHALALSDPRGYLEKLSVRSAFGTAIARGGLGDFFWFTYAS